MQQRRLRPGDVLDDYCPHERRVTDHAIVAMIDDTIQQTRCVVCDAEHEYKQAKVPAQRRKKAPALFNQVLDGLKAPARPAQTAGVSDMADGPEVADAIEFLPEDESTEMAPVDDLVTVSVGVTMADAIDTLPENGNGNGDAQYAPVAEALAAGAEDTERPEPGVDGPFRRRLIRAALPRPEGTPSQPTRAIPEFTIRQPSGRPNRFGGRRRAGQQQAQGQNGPMRFGRGGQGGQRSNGHGRPGGHGGPHGHGGANSNRGGSRRGGKKR